MITNFTYHLYKDCISLVKNDNNNSDLFNEANREQKIASVALRIAGVVLGVLAAITLFSGLCTMLVNPILGVGLLAIGAASLVLSHDSIVMGENKRLLLNDWDFESKNVGKIFANAFKTAYIAGKEMYTGVPAELEGTWLLKDIYVLCEGSTRNKARF